MSDSSQPSAKERATDRRRERLAEPPPLTEQLPMLALVALLLGLTLSLFYPSLAFPTHGIGVGIVIALALGLSAWAVACAPAKGSMGKLPLAACVLLILWCADWLWRLHAAPVFALGRYNTVTEFFGLGAFTISLFATASWRAEDFEEPAQGKSASHVSPVFLFCCWLALGFGAMAAYALYQSAGPEWAPGTFRAMEKDILSMPADFPLRDGLLHATRERRAAGTVGAANIFASFCAFAFAVALGCAFAVRRNGARIAYGLIAALLVAGVIGSGSRGGLLALLGGCVLFALLLAGWKLSGRKRAILFAVVGALFAVLFLCLVITLLNLDTYQNRWLGRTGMTQRFLYWKTAAEIWREDLFLGRGPGSFEALYAQFRQPHSNETRHAHSWFFQYGASVGILGVALFLALLAVCGTILERALARLADQKRFHHFALLSGLGAGAAAIIFHGLIEYTMVFREAALVFFSSLGVIAGMGARLANQEAAPAGKPVARAAFPLVAMAAVICAIMVYQIPPVRSTLSRDLAMYQVSDPQPEADAVRDALALLDRAIDLDPMDPSNFETRAELKERIGQPSSMQDVKLAMALDPYSARLHERLARMFAWRSELIAAIAEQRRAIALHPLDVTHRMTLVDFLLRDGDVKQAREEFDKTKDMLRPTPRENELYAATQQKLEEAEKQ